VLLKPDSVLSAWVPRLYLQAYGSDLSLQFNRWKFRTYGWVIFVLHGRLLLVAFLYLDATFVYLAFSHLCKRPASLASCVLSTTTVDRCFAVWPRAIRDMKTEVTTVV